MIGTLILDDVNPLATKVKTRNGQKARIICIDRMAEKPLVYLATSLLDGMENIQVAYIDGTSDNVPQPWDLINA